MKRSASSILVLVMLLSFSALFAVAENGVTVIDGGAYVSISVGKKYTAQAQDMQIPHTATPMPPVICWAS